MNTFLTILEFEVLILGILGCLGMAYYKTLKHIVLSNCVMVKFCGIEMYKKPLSDDILHEIVEDEETN